MKRAAPRDGKWGGPLEPVGPMVRQLLSRFGLDRRLEENRAVTAWPQVVGPAIAAQARAVTVRDGVLFVDVASSVWMQELGLLRDDIAARLNAQLGAPLVRKIVLSIERPPLQDTETKWNREVEESHDE